jgi:hypothetical protein
LKDVLHIMERIGNAGAGCGGPGGLDRFREE